MGLLLLASFGIFPVSVALGAVVVHDLGPAPLFPIAAAVLSLLGPSGGPARAAVAGLAFAREMDLDSFLLTVLSQEITIER